MSDNESSGSSRDEFVESLLASLNSRDTIKQMTDTNIAKGKGVQDKDKEETAKEETAKEETTKEDDASKMSGQPSPSRPDTDTTQRTRYSDYLIAIDHDYCCRRETEPSTETDKDAKTTNQEEQEKKDASSKEKALETKRDAKTANQEKQKKKDASSKEKVSETKRDAKTSNQEEQKKKDASNKEKVSETKRDAKTSNQEEQKKKDASNKEKGPETKRDAKTLNQEEQKKKDAGSKEKGPDPQTDKEKAIRKRNSKKLKKKKKKEVVMTTIYLNQMGKQKKIKRKIALARMAAKGLMPLTERKKKHKKKKHKHDKEREETKEEPEKKKRAEKRKRKLSKSEPTSSEPARKRALRSHTAAKLEEKSQCNGPGCHEDTRPGSLYCSQACRKSLRSHTAAKLEEKSQCNGPGCHENTRPGSLYCSQACRKSHYREKTSAESETGEWTRRKRNRLTIADKAQIIKEVESGSGIMMADIAVEWGISKSTLAVIMKDKEMVKERVRNPAFNPARKQLRRKAALPEIEEAILTWCRAAHNMDVLVPWPAFEEKVKSLAKKMGHPKFKCNDRWLKGFKRRHNVNLLSVPVQAVADPTEMAKRWLKSRLPHVLSSYKPVDIFSAAEAGILYRCLPDCCFKAKRKESIEGTKSKDLLTAMLCANMDGSEKMPLLVIGKSKSPGGFSDVKSLPTLYEANDKAWMTAGIFERWIRDIDKVYQGKKRRIALIIDKCLAHPHIKDLKSVKLVYLPPFTSSKFQPMDKGVIQSLKIHYRRYLITALLAAEDKKEYKPTTLDALHFLRKSWKKVRANTIADCYKLASEDNETIKLEAGISTIEDKHLFDQLRDAGMDVAPDATLHSYARIDADIKCTMKLTDEAILNAVTPSEEDEEDDEPPCPPVSIAEAVQCLDRLSKFASQKNQTENMLDSICDIEKVVDRVRKAEAKQEMGTDAGATIMDFQELNKDNEELNQLPGALDIDSPVLFRDSAALYRDSGALNIRGPGTLSAPRSTRRPVKCITLLINPQMRMKLAQLGKI